jgi:hypothetical protein
MLRFLGKGASACAVAPPLACALKSGVDTRNPAKSYISKISYLEEDDITDSAIADSIKTAQHEYESGLLMRAVDPEHRFTVAVDGWCTPNAEVVLETDVRAACDLSPHDLLLNQVFYEYGGVSLSKAAKDNLPNALQSLSSILQGLVTMSRASPPLIHGDIHQGNIVIGDDGVARLIDYGEVCTPATLWKRPGLLTVDSVYFPPERYIAVREFTGRFPEGIDESPRMDLLEDLGLSAESLMFQFEGMCNTFDTETTPFINDLKNPDDKRYYVLDVLADTFASTYDLFGLAMTVAMVCVRNEKQWKALPSRLRRAVRDWVAYAGRYNAYTRYTPAEALERWTDIWETKTRAV